MRFIPLLTLLILSLTSVTSNAQSSSLRVEGIMRDPKWIGTSPSNPFWSQDGQTLYFSWNPTKAPSDSLYALRMNEIEPKKVISADKERLNQTSRYQYNTDRTAALFTYKGDVFLWDVKRNQTTQITSTVDVESNPQFSFDGKRIVFTSKQQLYSWDRQTGTLEQLIQVKIPEGGNTPRPGGITNRNPKASTQESWLQQEQLTVMQVLRERKDKRDASEKYKNSLPKSVELRSISLEDKSLQQLQICPNGRYISYVLFKPAPGKIAQVPNYITESGFTQEIETRTKVGAPQGEYEMFFYDRIGDTLIKVASTDIPGVYDLPDFKRETSGKRTDSSKLRGIIFAGTYWSPGGKQAMLEVRSQDNKDRWLLCWDANTRKISVADRQHDEAWIGGPGIPGWGGNSAGWIDEDNFWYRSEKSGFAHLFRFQVSTKTNHAITSGSFEVQQASLSNDAKSFYITSNEVHPGEQHFYRVRIADGQRTKLTTAEGAHQVTLSPDEQRMAILFSTYNQPWELYLQKNIPQASAQAITDQARSDEFKRYPWRVPELIQIPARDGAGIYARLYKPANPHPSKPAVIFVHGAGYLQNAHKWWSSYFREYMFHNLLADMGYHVLDIDYRGSAGYGRDWRTGIYRHMGGKDLTDHVDAAKLLVDQYGVDPNRIGIYGGSYGGFITLMALFTTPDVFKAGAALRPVTDWANYNHGYTSNILNEPNQDSIAYRRSSPIYFAEGLKNHLLICHGMLDLNVHYQDAVKLTQRLIELGKQNWELASYPMEDHGFVEPSSWTDEYQRILALFERVLKGPAR
ncbi:MAG: prolyl oligopeptidase family serine peptidase [Bacteroidota bacterium]